MRSFWLPLSILLAAGSVSAAEPAARTVLDGVYSQSQASRGKTAYTRYCGDCHLKDLEGGALEPPLVSVLFLDSWREDHLYSLFDFIQTRMPKGRDNKPGSLREEQYLDIVAYILERNDFPAGPQELTRADLDTTFLVGLNGPEPLPPSAMVRTVGCFEQGEDGWKLHQAVAPARVREGDETNPVELEKSAAMALGTIEFSLNNLDVLHEEAELQAVAGQKMQVKGVLNGKDATARIFVLSLEAAGSGC